MKLITLNVWGGRVYKPLINFINKHKAHTDIFTFQEIFKSDRNISVHEARSNILADIANVLPDFDYYFSSTADGWDDKSKVDFPLSYGQATFTKKEVKVTDQGDEFVYKKFNEVGPQYENGTPDFPRNIVFSEIEREGIKFLVLNFHGFWQPSPKFDTPERIKQSEAMIEFSKKKGLPTIIAGDFNLMINSKSIEMFEKHGFRNLVKESKATTTRSKFYDIKWRAIDKFADYILVSKGIWIKDFKVLRANVSDHLPLYLEFDV